MAAHHDTAAYFHSRAAEERAKAERAPNENVRRLYCELADLFDERALIAEQATQDTP